MWNYLLLFALNVVVLKEENRVLIFQVDFIDVFLDLCHYFSGDTID